MTQDCCTHTGTLMHGTDNGRKTLCGRFVVSMAGDAFAPDDADDGHYCATCVKSYEGKRDRECQDQSTS